MKSRALFQIALALNGLCFGMYLVFVWLPRRLDITAGQESVVIANNKPQLDFDDSGTLESPLKCDIVNKTKTPVKIIGASSSCSCAILNEELPKVIRSGEMVSLPIKFSPPETGEFTNSIDVYTDDPVSKVLTFSFSGYVGRKSKDGGDPH